MRRIYTDMTKAGRAGRSRDRLATRCHADGSITYWSVMRQRWVKRGWAIDRADLAAMSGKERERVLAHLARHGWLEIAGGTYAAPAD